MNENDPIPISDRPLAQGMGVIRALLAELPTGPGVYRMLDAKGDVLYVGKAKNLRNRVGSYASASGLSTRILRMVSHTSGMEIVTTKTEAEALLLEANLIKKFQPRYNILLRDDKSFPFIFIATDHPYPQIVKHRGAQDRKGHYFGPFASVGAVNETITTLQRAFLLRPCPDTVFKQRTRPCLQYQIKRCSAPCVAKISETDYGALVNEAVAFLSGKSREIQNQLAAQMQDLSDQHRYEEAAVLRDRIRALTQVQQEHRLHAPTLVDADVIALHRDGPASCIQVFFFRAGQNFGNRSFFPQHPVESEDAEILSAFIGQFYQRHPPPRQIVLSHLVEETSLLEDALSLGTRYRVELLCPQKGEKRDAVRQAQQNARQALERHLNERAGQNALLEQVATHFGLEGPPSRIEVYDNSHIMGTNAVGAMIVAGPEGWRKTAYRKFNIKSTELTPGDDYAMMREVLQRRFTRMQKEDGERPDLVLIDGGTGQLQVALQMFADLGISDLPVVAIAKGPDRNAGREQFFLPGRPPFQLPPGDPALHYLQRLRDEAHRFAIGTHRAKRSAGFLASELDAIAGIGTTRKKALLHHFGSSRAVGDASIAELEKVPGINRKVAEMIYRHFHGS